MAFHGMPWRIQTAVLGFFGSVKESCSNPKIGGPIRYPSATNPEGDMQSIQPINVTNIYGYPFAINDAGRAKSRRPKQKRDCAVVAISIACEISYDDAFDLLRDAGRESNKGFRGLLQWANERSLFYPVNGYKFARLKPFHKDEFSPSTFAEKYPSGRFLVHVKNHIIAMIDGVFMDDGPISLYREIQFALEVHKPGKAKHGFEMFMLGDKA